MEQHGRKAAGVVRQRGPKENDWVNFAAARRDKRTKGARGRTRCKKTRENLKGNGGPTTAWGGGGNERCRKENSPKKAKRGGAGVPRVR